MMSSELLACCGLNSMPLLMWLYLRPLVALYGSGSLSSPIWLSQRRWKEVLDPFFRLYFRTIPRSAIVVCHNLWLMVYSHKYQC
jgi:hypothetical protein